MHHAHDHTTCCNVMSSSYCTSTDSCQNLVKNCIFDSVSVLLKLHDSGKSYDGKFTFGIKNDNCLTSFSSESIFDPVLPELSAKKNSFSEVESESIRTVTATLKNSMNISGTLVPPLSKWVSSVLHRYLTEAKLKADREFLEKNIVLNPISFSPKILSDVANDVDSSNVAYFHPVEVILNSMDSTYKNVITSSLGIATEAGSSENTLSTLRDYQTEISAAKSRRYRDLRRIGSFLCLDVCNAFPVSTILNMEFPKSDQVEVVAANQEELKVVNDAKVIDKSPGETIGRLFNNDEFLTMEMDGSTSIDIFKCDGSLKLDQSNKSQVQCNERTLKAISVLLNPSLNELQVHALRLTRLQEYLYQLTQPPTEDDLHEAVESKKEYNLQHDLLSHDTMNDLRRVFHVVNSRFAASGAALVKTMQIFGDKEAALKGNQANNHHIHTWYEKVEGPNRI